MGQAQHARIAGRIGSFELDDLAGAQAHFVAYQLAYPDLGALKIGDDRHRLVKAPLSFTDGRNAACVLVLFAMAEVQAEAINPRFDQHDQAIRSIARWPQRRDNLASPGSQMHLTASVRSNQPNAQECRAVVAVHLIQPLRPFFQTALWRFEAAFHDSVIGITDARGPGCQVHFRSDPSHP